MRILSVPEDRRDELATLRANVAARVGVDVTRHRPLAQRRAYEIDQRSITLVLGVGVLRGASRTLDQVQLVECELSIIPLYADQLTLRPTLELLSGADFELIDLEPGQRGTGRATLYIDALFRRF